MTVGERVTSCQATAPPAASPASSASSGAPTLKTMQKTVEVYSSNLACMTPNTAEHGLKRYMEESVLWGGALLHPESDPEDFDCSARSTRSF